MTSFSNLGLAEPIVRALEEAHLSTPTPIQDQAIPKILAGRDLIGIAQTGTGKTAAFALPILDRLIRHRRKSEPKAVRVLVLSPTRELSGQIVDSFESFGRHAGITVELAIGGVPMGRQIRALGRGVDVLVATPGRLLDLADNRAVRLDQVEVLVLDEADQMLDMGFVHAIRAIVRRIPQKRHSLFFSATMPQAIAELAGSMLHDPVTVAVTPVAKTADRVEQRVIHVDKARKGALLAEVLSQEPIDRALVFTRTKHGADKVVRVLAKAGHPAEAIHGNKSQNQRDRVLQAFRDGEIRVLIATDIAARGIDVTGVSHVVNYDLPNVPESYVHRIGRTARAGREGIAISFCDHEERAFLKSIERLIKMQIPASDRRGAAAPEAIADVPSEERPARPQNAGRRGGSSGGPSGGHRGERQRFGEGQPQREGRPPRRNGEGRSFEARSGEGRSFEGRGPERREDGRKDAHKPRNPHARGEHPRGEHPRSEDARGHGGGRPERSEGRGQRAERGPASGTSTSGKPMGAIGFMKAVPERGQRPRPANGAAKGAGKGPARRPAR
ncbi:DEAD/DEAH box helicase [Xanthobacter pseudotagetidis]|uniref:DEAD/DEAH box helicase n=1 Tax=Xanthobacter pseudotagetidis TaxID=3119911 RepID=UPI00372BEBDD